MIKQIILHAVLDKQHQVSCHASMHTPPPRIKGCRVGHGPVALGKIVVLIGLAISVMVSRCFSAGLPGDLVMECHR